MAEFHFLTPALTWTRMAQRRRSPYTGNRLILINIWISTDSNHHLQHKRAVVNTLLLRTHTLLSEEVDKVKEIQHVKEALKANNYPDWMLTIPNTGSDLDLQHKRAVVNTLLLRTHTLLSEEVDKVKEIQHVKEALKANNYPDWMLTIPNTGSASRDSEEFANEKRIYASVPYIKGTS